MKMLSTAIHWIRPSGLCRNVAARPCGSARPLRSRPIGPARNVFACIHSLCYSLLVICPKNTLVHHINVYFTIHPLSVALSLLSSLSALTTELGSPKSENRLKLPAKSLRRSGVRGQTRLSGRAWRESYISAINKIVASGQAM